MPSHTVYNLMLSLPDLCGWHDRLLAWVTAKGSVVYIVNTRVGSAPLTPEALEAAQDHAARSLRAEDISARNELARRR